MKKLFLTQMILFVFLSGCSKEITEPLPDTEKETKTPIVEKDVKEENTLAKTEETKEGKTIKQREDAGDFTVKLDGEIQLKDNVLIASGSTNLLPGSKLLFDTQAIQGVLIGSTSVTLVEEDGSFKMESSIPSDYLDSIILTEIRFRSSDSNEDITTHYSESGDSLEGPFVHMYEENNEMRKEVKAQTLVPLSQPETTVSIQPPSWEKPDDYGSTSVRIKASVKEDGDYIYISGKSNLLEGASLQGMLDIEGYIASGFSHRVYANPDGSFEMTILHPKKKIPDLKGYKLNITFEPSNPNNFAYIPDTYGEKGEKLKGNLVKNENNEKRIIYSP